MFKFAEMEEDFSWNVMMGILKMEMVAILIAKFSLAGVVQEDLVYRQVAVLNQFQIKAQYH